MEIPQTSPNLIGFAIRALLRLIALLLLPAGSAMADLPAINSGTFWGTVGQYKSYQITADQPLTGHFASGLPPGLTLEPVTGLISGILTTAGTFECVLSGENSNGIATPVTRTFTVYAEEGSTPGVSGSLFISGFPGSTITHQIVATGLDPSSSFTVDNLPDGLTLNPGTGLITGNLQTPGIHSLPLRVSNIYGTTTKELNVVISTPVWVSRSSPASGVLRAVTYGNGLFAAVGDGGTIITSSDSITWTLRASPTTSQLNGIVFDQGLFVAVGNLGTIVTSTDGVAWSAQTSGTSAKLNAIAARAGQFTVVGAAGAVLNSSNGSSWTPANSSISQELLDICAGNELVAVGTSGVIIRSADGIQWTPRSSSVSTALRAIAYDGERYVVAGDSGSILVSTDTVTWTPRTSGTTSALFEVISAEGRLIAMGASGTLRESDDAQYWAARNSSVTVSLNASTFADNRFVAVGNGGTIVSASSMQPPAVFTPAAIYARAGDLFQHTVTSSDGPATYRAFALPSGLSMSADGAISGSAASPGTYTARLVASNDNGVSLPLTLTITVYPASGTLPAITSALAATGAVGTAFSYTITATRTDPTTVYQVTGLPPGWTFSGTKIQSVPSVPGVYQIGLRVTNIYGGTESNLAVVVPLPAMSTYSGPGSTIMDMEYAGGQFVAVGLGGKVLTSADGIQWNPQSFGGSYNMTALCYSDGLWVAVGDDERVLTSTDGITWIVRNTGSSTPDLRGVTFGNGRFVAVGTSGYILISTDGATWSRLQIQDSAIFNDILFSDGNFVAVGNSGLLLTSTDGLTWTKQNAGTGHNLTSIISEAGLYLIATSNGKILRSADRVIWHEILVNSSAGFHAFAWTGDRFVVAGGATAYVSHDGINWGMMGGISGSSGPIEFAQDKLVLSNGATIYRFEDLAPALLMPSRLNARQNSPFSYQMGAVGEVTTYHAFNLPSGLSINEATGLISGIPTTQGTFTLSLVAVNGAGPGVRNTVDLVVTAPTGTAPIVNSSLNARGTVDKPFLYQFTVPTGSPGVSYQIGSLPPGLSAAGGAITGVPRQAGIFPISAQVTNVYGTTTVALTITITANPWEDTHFASADSFNGLAFGNDLFVMVGETNVIQSSPDGLTWTTRLTDNTLNLNSVTYGDAGFVAVGESGTSGTVVTSPDGITWTRQPQILGVRLFAVTYGSGLYVAVGSAGKIYSSPDGVSWTLRSLSPASTVDLRTVTYGEGKFVSGGSGDLLFAVSDDGLAWSALPNGTLTGSIQTIAYKSGSFVALGTSKKIYTSPDGYNWTEVTPTIYEDDGSLNTVEFSFSALTSAGDYFVALASYPVSEELVLTSSDGVNWRIAKIESPYSLYCLAYGNERLVLAGSNGTVFSSPALLPPEITKPDLSAVRVGQSYSLNVSANREPTEFYAAGLPDGLSFESATGTISGVPQQEGVYEVILGAKNAAGPAVPVVFSLHVFATNGASPVITSANVTTGKVTYPLSFQIQATGKDVTTRYSADLLPLGLALDPITGLISGVPLTVWNQPVTLSVSNIYGTSTSMLTFSIGDGAWHNHGVTATDPIRGIAFGGGQFIAVVNGWDIFTSPDGTAWTDRSFDTPYTWYDVTYGSGIYVAVGDSGRVFTSPDGITWTQRSTGVSSGLYCITWANGLFVAAGASVILTSPDGITWTQRLNAGSFDMAIFGGGQFLVGGSGGLLYTSPDGIAWTQRTAGVTANLLAGAYGNGQFVVCGDSGTVITSPDGIAWTQRAFGVSGTLRAASYGNGIFIIAGSNGIARGSADGITWAALNTGYTSDEFYAAVYANGKHFIAGQKGIILSSVVSPTLTSSTTATGRVGESFTYTVTAEGNPTEYMAMPLPSGLTLNPVTGVISGIPLSSGTFKIALGAASETGHAAPSLLTLAIAPPVEINSPAVAGAAAGHPFTYAIEGVGNPNTFSAELPPELTLDPGTGVITGVFGAPGSYLCNLTAGNSYGSSPAFPLTITVYAASGPLPKLTSPNRLLSFAASSIDYSLTYTGNDVSSRVSVSGLPPGITFDPATNKLQGTIETPGTYSIEVTFTNVHGSHTTPIVFVVEDTEWTRRASGTSADLCSILFHNGQFIASGNGVIVTSPDGQTWTTRASGLNGVFRGLSRSADNYLAVSASGNTVVTSPDGITWTQRTTGSSFGLNDAVYGDTFVAVGNTGRILTSPDGVAWTQQTSGTNSTLERVIWANHSYMIPMNTELRTSADAITWSSQPGISTTKVTALYHDGAQYLGATGNRIYTSTDAVTWAPRTPAGDTFLDIERGGQYLAVGSAGAISRSLTGHSWSKYAAVTSAQLNSIAYGNGLCVVVGDGGTVLTAADEAPPLLLSAGKCFGTVGVPLTYSITAQGNPSHFSASGLPQGLSVDETSGVISGTPGSAGRFFAVVRAGREDVESSATVEFLIEEARPIVTQQPANVTVHVGDDVNLSVTALGGSLQYQWRKGGVLISDGEHISGSSTATLTLTDVTLAEAGQYSVIIDNPAGSRISANALVTVLQGFDDWAQDQELPAGQSGPDADPYQTGISNLLAYSLGINPGNPDRNLLPVVQIENNMLTLTFGRPKHVYGISYSVTVSSNLEHWSDTGVTLWKASEDASQEVWKGATPTNLDPKFIRLEVHRD